MDIEALVTEAKDLIEGVIRKHAATVVPVIEDDARRVLTDAVGAAMKALNDIAEKVTALGTPVTAPPAEPVAPVEPAAPKSPVNPAAYGQ